VELRRALLLFAIVLGLAAIVSSLARPPASEEQADRGGPRSEPAGPTQPTAGSRPATRRTPVIRFGTEGKPKTETLTAGTAATVRVRVQEPGLVNIAGLGLDGQAAPLTPARFDVLSTRPGRYEVRFTAVPDDRSRLVGFLQIVPAPLP
jgi:hypothetical protein